nr:WD repeat-containing protein 25 isoform X2 [Symphalangus syndactylus]
MTARTPSLMASLVAYDDSDSEAETEPAGSFNATGQMKDTSSVARSPGQDFASGTLDVPKAGAQPTKHGSCEDPGGHRLPLAQLGRSDRGSCPSQRLQWPGKEPQVTFPIKEPSCSSLWTSHVPASHMPLAAARFKQVKLSRNFPKSSFRAQNGHSSHADPSYTGGSGASRGTEALRGSQKVWNAVDSGHCLQTYSLHTEAVRAAQWAPCGRRILSGGFDFALHLTDLETGTQLFSGRSDFRITTLKFHPKDHNIFLCGGFSSEMKAWDIRTGKVMRSYKATIQQTLDILFLRDGSEFLSSTDASTRDSADRTIIAWDFRTSAKISNQIFHERFTCPSLALHPREPVFLAQTNGNYLALFSTVWPYRMSRRRRYEGHKVEGYSVGCECSPGGDLLVTGSADGRVLMYSFRTASRACTLQGHTQACVGTTYHPVLPSVLATCSWGGDMKIWH